MYRSRKSKVMKWTMAAVLAVNAVVGGIAVRAEAFPTSGQLRYDRPGQEWDQQALPLGNGYLNQ